MPKLEVNPQEFDSRMVEWHLKGGKITKESLESYLKSLPDDAGNAQPVSFDEDDSTPSSN